jgi:hypothetical protein
MRHTALISLASNTVPRVFFCLFYFLNVRSFVSKHSLDIHHFYRSLQYDILGVDLDDDEVEQNGGGGGGGGAEDENGEGGPEPQTTSQGIVQEIASLALTSVLQLVVRTGA